MTDDFDFDDLLRQMGRRDDKYRHLYTVHPSFDNYPDYLKQGLLANERLQGRIK